MIYILLPAFNEEASIGKLLNSILKTSLKLKEKCRVIVVNDGSTDKTEKVVKSFQNRMNLKLINHQKNSGLGNALKTGFTEVLKIGGDKDILITMDADNTHPPELILKMAEDLKKGSDLVIASRFLKGSKVKGLKKNREMLSFLASIIFRILLPIKGVKDYTSGFRGYQISFLKKAFKYYSNNLITQEGFSSMAEILIKLRPLSPKISEVPLNLRYDLKEGKSKMKILKTIKETLGLLMINYQKPGHE